MKFIMLLCSLTYTLRGDNGAADKGAVERGNSKSCTQTILDSQLASLPGAGDFRSSDDEPKLNCFITGFRGAAVRGVPYSDLGFLGATSTL